LPIARPSRSRTTTGTDTRFTRLLKVTGASWEVISGALGAWPLRELRAPRSVAGRVRARRLTTTVIYLFTRAL
jgi:hypothetical protein